MYKGKNKTALWTVSAVDHECADGYLGPEPREVLVWDFRRKVKEGWFCETLLCGAFLGGFVFVGFLFCIFFFFFLLPAAYYPFCWSHSAVDELSIGWVSEEQILCVSYAQVTAKTAVRGHLSSPLGPFFPLPVVRVICAFTRLQSLAGLARVQNFLEDKQ